MKPVLAVWPANTVNLYACLYLTIFLHLLADLRPKELVISCHLLVCSSLIIPSKLNKIAFTKSPLLCIGHSSQSMMALRGGQMGESWVGCLDRTRWGHCMNSLCSLGKASDRLIFKTIGWLFSCSAFFSFKKCLLCDNKWVPAYLDTLLRLIVSRRLGKGKQHTYSSLDPAQPWVVGLKPYHYAFLNGKIRMSFWIVRTECVFIVVFYMSLMSQQGRSIRTLLKNRP